MLTNASNCQSHIPAKANSVSQPSWTLFVGYCAFTKGNLTAERDNRLDRGIMLDTERR